MSAVNISEQLSKLREAIDNEDLTPDEKMRIKEFLSKYEELKYAYEKDKTNLPEGVRGLFPSEYNELLSQLAEEGTSIFDIPIKQIITNLAKEQYDFSQMEADAIAAQMYHESGYNIAAVSSVGAFGISQLMPATAEGLDVDRYNPFENIIGGLKYMRQLKDQFQSLPVAICAYNCGPNRKAIRYLAETVKSEEIQDDFAKVAQEAQNTNLPQETKDYIVKIAMTVTNASDIRYINPTAIDYNPESHEFIDVEMLHHDEALAELGGFYSYIWSSKHKVDESREKGATSFEGLRRTTAVGYKLLCRETNFYEATLTGGTELGHASYEYSHWNGYKLDIDMPGAEKIWEYAQANGSRDKSGKHERRTFRMANFRYRIINEGSHLDIEIVPV